MAQVEVTTQAQLDEALKDIKPSDYVVCKGGTWDRPLVVRGSSHVVAWGSSHVVARERSHVVARERSHVVAWGSSHVVARERSHVEAWGSSHVEAWGSSHVVARERSHVEASQLVSVHKHGTRPQITGGVIIDVPDVGTLSAADWCGYYGVTVTRGKATLFKSVDDDYSTAYARAAGIFYTVGAKVKAPDWEPQAVCGNGLHVSPRPALAEDYHKGTRYVSVKASVKDMVVIGDKVKVPALVVTAEVDRWGGSV